ncbi:MAG TPA: tetratricopeptide repeat protein [Pyrinomonadaceae bacterium]|jgi:tetratricopeptide (TPR) repeat protein
MGKSRLIIVCALFSAIFALTAVHAKAQTFYEIEGVVEGPDATPLNGVAVFLEDLTRARVAQAITSSDGRYRFNRIVAGTYYIVVQPNNSEFRTAVRRIELIETTRVGSSTSTERVDIALEAMPRRTSSGSTTIFAQEVPPEATARFERALDKLGKKNTDEAIRELNEALRIFPNYFMATQQLGLLYVELENYQKAIPPLVKAIEINAKAAPAYLALGIASLKLGHPDLAMDALQRARPLDERSFRVHFYLGLTLIELNRLEEAETALKLSYQLGGPHKAASAHLYLASIYSKRGQNKQAVDELESYLHDSPKAANAARVRDAITNLKSKL